MTHAAIVWLQLVGAAPAAWAADAPAWLLRVAGTPAAANEARARAVVLHDETHTTVSPDGRVVTKRTYAVRVLTRDGSDAARVHEVYTTTGGQVRSMRGWVLIEGEVVELGRDAVVDLALADNDVYNEARVRVLSAGRAALPGVVFGAETETVERTVFTQFEWMPQQAVPVRSARRMLTLPSGSSVRTLTFNAPRVEEARNGSSWSWSVRDLPPLEQEPAAPPLNNLAARVAVTYDVPERPGTAFGDWGAVSSWLEALAAPQSAATAVLQAKARELTAGASTDLDRIRALGRYAQQVQYISIQTGLGRGGGYTPHAAADVLAKNYGDCKDKANLLRVLLGSVGIRAHLVTVYAGDPDYVRTEWPSPQQFNHAIVAVVVPPATMLPAATSHPTLGRVLFFDPTDEHTPVGELPTILQGSYGLLVAPREGSLVRMPTSPSDANASERVVNATLDAQGGLAATLRHSTVGGPATAERQALKALSAEEYVRRLTVDVRRQVSGARLALGRVGDDLSANRFDVVLTLEAPGYAQVVQGRLFIVRPPELTHLRLPRLEEGPRTQPIQLDAHDGRDMFELTLPAGMAVDELPPPAALATSFGRFAVTWQTDGMRVVRRVSLQVARARVAASQIDDVRMFFQAFRDAERRALVLVRL